MIKKYAEAYGRFVARRPLIVLLLVVVITFAGIYGTGFLTITSLDNRDFLPEGVEVLEVFELIESKFGGTESENIVIELNNRALESRSIDVRDPDVLEYAALLKQRAGLIEDVIGVDTITDFIKQANGGTIPKSLDGVKSILDDSDFTSAYIDSDYSMLLINMRLAEEYEYHDLYKEIIAAIEDTKASKPSYVDVNPSGQITIGVATEELIGPDIGKTSVFSYLSIFIIVFLLFLSFRHSIISLMAITFGIIWALGIVGLLGFSLTSITSGAISMTLGIGIDFGIQMVTRFRQELRENSKDLEKTMQKTMVGVSIPMGTTTVAALIGFWAMGTGRLSLIGELAKVMSYGVFFSFLAAMTVIPVLLILNEKISKKK